MDGEVQYCPWLQRMPSACGAVMREDTHGGKAGMRCSKKARQRRVSSVSGGILEVSHLTPKELLVLAYYWANDCAGLRAENLL